MIYQDFSAPVQKYVRGIALLLLVGLVVSSFAIALYYAVSAREVARSHLSVREIAFSGEGKVSMKPDIATMRATVTTQSKKVGDGQSQNSMRSNAVMDFLKNQGVAEKDIKTASYAITPQYQYAINQPCTIGGCPPQRPPTIVSYDVRHVIEVKIRDLKKVDAVLEGVVISGANEVDGLQFMIDDEELIKAAARKEAIENAEKKARVLAEDLGISLKRIVSFSESGEGVPIYQYGLKAALDRGESSASAPQVAPGEQEVRSTVTITYEFR